MGAYSALWTRELPTAPSSDRTHQRLRLSLSVSTAGGGVADGHGEGKAGTRVHESKAVLDSAVSGRKGNSLDEPSGREKETLGGSSGDEVSVFRLLPRTRAY